MLFVGLLVTMPLILFGSAMLMKLMERFPAFITIGAGLLGYVAGEMAVGDPAIKDYVEMHAHPLDTLAPIVGALFVVVAGNLLARKKTSEGSNAIAPEAQAAKADTGPTHGGSAN